jgi:hypothetical protein
MKAAADDRAHRSQRDRAVTVRQYVDRRIGPGPAWRQTYEVLVVPFLAESLSEFWRRWNPVWGYWLARLFYQPLRSRIPRPVAVLLTFVASGVVHNLLAVLLTGRLSLFTTLFFALLGSGVVIADLLHVRFTALPRPLRVPLHLGYLRGVFWLASILVSP